MRFCNAIQNMNFDLKLTIIIFFYVKVLKTQVFPTPFAKDGHCLTVSANALSKNKVHKFY